MHSKPDLAELANCVVATLECSKCSLRAVKGSRLKGSCNNSGVTGTCMRNVRHGISISGVESETDRHMRGHKDQETYCRDLSKTAVVDAASEPSSKNLSQSYKVRGQPFVAFHQR